MFYDSEVKKSIYLHKTKIPKPVGLVSLLLSSNLGNICINHMASRSIRSNHIASRAGDLADSDVDTFYFAFVIAKASCSF